MQSQKDVDATPVQCVVMASASEKTLPKPYYDQDGITIYHCDAMTCVEALPDLDAVVTDPPYGIVGKFGSSDLYGTRNMQFTFDQPEGVMEHVAAIVDVVASKAKALHLFCDPDHYGCISRKFERNARLSERI